MNFILCGIVELVDLYTPVIFVISIVEIACIMINVGFVSYLLTVDFSPISTK